MPNTFSLETVPTPALIVDATIVRNNLRRLADYATTHHLKVRPHTKTHKSRFMARLQAEHGASGITVAKFGEAEVMSEVTDDLLLAYPALDPWRARHVAELARRKSIRVAVDSRQAVEALAAEAVNARSKVGILVELDVGLHRTGVQSPQAALELAQLVDRTTGVRLDGLLCYPGHVWNPPDEQQVPLAKVAEQLQETLDLWKKHGLQAEIVSGGSTPTAYQSHLIPQLTEIRPRTYIYNDMNTVRGGYCTLDDCAARILCTVVSNAVPDQVVLDCATKTLTSDLCIPARDAGHGLIVEYAQAKITALSEEHSQVNVSKCDQKPRLGERVTVIPNHICPCVNLQDVAWWREIDSSHLKPIPIDARGKLV